MHLGERGSHVSAYDTIARYYDLVSAHDDRDIALFAALARRLDGPVLELGVGTGRVALALAGMGFEVTGIDDSPAMLALARDKAGAAGVSPRLERATFADFDLGARFGLIVCAADSFLHALTPEVQIAALQRAAAHLTPGGRLVLDLPAFAGPWLDWEPGARPLDLIWSGSLPDGGFLHYLGTFEADPALQTRHITHLFDVTSVDGTLRRQTVRSSVRFIFPAELTLLVQAAGLAVEAIHGGYDLEPFDGAAERMIAVLRSP